MKCFHGLIHTDNANKIIVFGMLDMSASCSHACVIGVNNVCQPSVKECHKQQMRVAIADLLLHSYQLCTITCLWCSLSYVRVLEVIQRVVFSCVAQES